MIPSESINQRNNIIHSHRKVILELRVIEEKISQLIAANDNSWTKLEIERSRIQHQVEPLIEEYWRWIPEVELSLCPFCNSKLKRRFDLIDLKGFWWMDRTQRDVKESSACEHFCLLTGALNFNGLKPEGGLFDGFPGPDAPFVIPRILRMEGMVAVVSQIQMHCGYSAYPIAYFSKTPPKERSLTQSWARKEYHFTLNGKRGWDVVEDELDYDLEPWIKKEKLCWVIGGNLNARKSSCPFLKVEGKRKKQRIVGDEVVYF